ncbi:MAG: creatininase family protein [Pseudomonadota bacterium]
MKLALATWPEVEQRIRQSPTIVLPTGSTEQHGPVGLVGTDAICAEAIAEAAAERCDLLIAPTLAYTPAPFNTHFPGTISLSAPVFEQMALEIISGLAEQGFRRIYILNGHGANLEPLRNAAAKIVDAETRIRSWWDFEPVNGLRRDLYGDWEGMHATPSEVAITQALHRTVISPEAAEPPEKLSADYIARHAGDKHGPPDEHRRRFPDGRVGSHSALAHPEHGRRLLSTAVDAVAKDLAEFAASAAKASS